MWISLLLGIPDGVTYGHFGLLCGAMIAVKLGLGGAFGTAFGWVFGLGAAIGVACFAMNNVSREYRLVFGAGRADTGSVSCQRGRTALRFFCFVVALVSVIPFMGMAMVAASTFSAGFFILLVVSNTLARFCMNDYALNHVFSKVFDRIYLGFLVFRNSDDRRRAKMLMQLRSFGSGFKCMSEQELKQCLANIERNPMLLLSSVHLMESKKNAASFLSDVLSVCGFFAGAYTATYLYWFSLKASLHILALIHIHSLALASTMAVFGVVPTALLWGTDTASAITVVYRKVGRWLRNHRMHRSLISPLYRYEQGCVVLGLVFFALTGAISETYMTHLFLSHQYGWYALGMAIFAPIAFWGVYTVGVVQVINKAFSFISSICYPHHSATAYQHLLSATRKASIFLKRMAQVDVDLLYDDLSRDSS